MTKKTRWKLLTDKISSSKQIRAKQLVRIYYLRE
jgi:hypothetical protein